jgi:hypothetical protein
MINRLFGNDSPSIRPFELCTGSSDCRDRLCSRSASALSSTVCSWTFGRAICKLHRVDSEADFFAFLDISERKRREVPKLLRNPVCAKKDVEERDEMEGAGGQKHVSHCTKSHCVERILHATYEIMK